MYTCKQQAFNAWLENSLQVVLCAKDGVEALNMAAQSVVAYYPGTKIWFFQQFGKRLSYITGAGQESFCESEQIGLSGNYGVFLQNFPNVDDAEKDILISFLKITAALRLSSE